ncbi:MAG: hypothetical protein F4201_11925 [Nitrospira sp. SB0677_bin_15]|nr:hypothetical protein [Nitrospira sp. SB0677_bin_15]
MRTTITIDNDVLAVARALAERNGTSLGRAISDLARRGFRSAHVAMEQREGTVFAAASDAGPITSDDVYRSLSDWP